ncbi:MAG: HEAT repeat domain-containing protein, partial [Acidobacteria bacterium]|nr:HEAT repeat domain-containing protein [Acidobacteriota bacterium]
LKAADDLAFERFRQLCHAVGPAVIPPLAEVLSGEQEGRARRRLREILLGFGPRGREAVQLLMNARNPALRRTAAFLLREFGGAEGLTTLEPLLNDSEPMVQREAIRAIVLQGNEAAYELLLRSVEKSGHGLADTLADELGSLRDHRAGPLFCFLVKRLDARAFAPVILNAIAALGVIGGADAVDALRYALHVPGAWWSPGATRVRRAAAAEALGRIKTPDALQTLREAAARGPRGMRAAARAQLEQRKHEVTG